MMASVLAFRITDSPLNGIFHISLRQRVAVKSSVRWHSIWELQKSWWICFMSSSGGPGSDSSIPRYGPNTILP